MSFHNGYNKGTNEASKGIVKVYFIMKLYQIIGTNNFPESAFWKEFDTVGGKTLYGTILVRVHLPQGYRATKGRQFTLNQQILEIPSTHFINLRRGNTSNLEPPDW